MILGTELFFAFFILIILLFLKLLEQKKDLKKHDQNSKVIQLLQAYPVHRYSIDHMLERSLAIIFSHLQLSAVPKGAVFLLHNGQLSFSAERGLNGFYNASNADELSLEDFFLHCSNKQIDIDRFQFISDKMGERRSRHKTHLSQGYFICPLVRHNKQLGVMILFTSRRKKTIRKSEIKFIKSIAISLASLIERKQIADEMGWANSFLNLSQQAVLITDKDKNIIRSNESCERITGYNGQELLGKNPVLLSTDAYEDGFYHELWQQVDENGFWQGEISYQRKDRSVFSSSLNISAIKNGDNQITHYLAIFTDITAIKKAETDIEQLSYFDALTQLPNRTLFYDRVEQAINRADRQNSQFALLYMDIDNFKKVNETLGHAKGDKLLKILVDRLTPVLRKDDSLARMGGDEFAMLIQDLNEKNNSRILLVIEKVLHRLKQPIKLSGHDFIVTASIGISVYPNDAENAADLIKSTDIAMSQAKQAGRNRYQFYTEKFNQQALRKLSMESALRKALKDNDFELYLQSQHGLYPVQLSGAEVLLRVKSGELSSVSPAEYIPVAEESGLIVEIGDWVFLETCRLIRIFFDNNLFPDSFSQIAVNISPVQFSHPDFIKKIQQSLVETQVPVEFLEVELTESALQESSSSVMEKLLAIKDLGITIAIDDFGTGYSSLNRLKQFPIDLLKIDRLFVNDICSNRSDTAIVKAIIAMSNALDIKILAEGIETEQQAFLLKTLNCTYGQGFLFNKPMPVEQFENLLQSVQQQTLVG